MQRILFTLFGTLLFVSAAYLARPGRTNSLIATSATTTPASQVYLPQVTMTCTSHTVTFDMQTSAAQLAVGQLLTVTLTLSNQGCASVGLPLYRLPVDYAGEPIFEPADPEPINHSLGLNTGQSDSADFVLRAVRPGQATLSPSVSFKVHLSYPGPSYWSGSAAPAQTVTVTP